MTFRNPSATFAAFACAVWLTGMAGAAAQLQSSVSGTVVDPSGAAVVDAAVTLTSRTGALQGKTATDSSGSFTVPNLPPGHYVVQVEQKLFNPVRLEVDVVDGVVTQPLRVELAVGGVTESVDIQAPAGLTSRATTTATKTEAPLFDTPVAVSIVPRELIAQQKVGRIKEALENVSSVRATNPGGSGNFFLIRGFSNGGVVLRDSLSAVTDQSFRTEFDSYNVDRIEVLKGPASVLYGRAQPGGIVNVVTARPQGESAYAFEQRLGTFDQRRTEFHSTGPLRADKTLLYRVDAVYEDSGSFRENVAQQRRGISPSLTWRPNTATDLTVAYEHLSTGYQLDNGLVAFGREVADIPRERSLSEPTNPQDDFNQSYVATDFDRRFGQRWKLHHRFLSSLRDSLDIGTSAFSGASPLKADGRTLERNTSAQVSDTRLYSTNLELLADLTHGAVRHQTLVGFDYLHDYSKYSQANLFSSRNAALDLDIFNPVHTVGAEVFSQTLDVTVNGVHNRSVYWNHNYGLYFQDQMTIGGPLHVLLGGRYDKAETGTGSGLTHAEADTNLKTRLRHDDAFSPRAGVLYQPVRWLGTYVSYTSSFSGNNGISAAGQTFEPQRGKQLEIGLKTEFFGGGLSATVAAFDLRRRNLLVADLTTADPSDSVLVGEQRSEGVELEVSGRVTRRLNGFGSYTYNDRAWVARDNPVASGGLQGRVLPNVARHMGSLWFAWDVSPAATGDTRIGFGVWFSGARQGDIQNTFDLPAYGRADAWVAHTYRLARSRLTVQLNLRNLFDEQYYEVASSRGAIYPGAPRAVSASLALTF